MNSRQVKVLYVTQKVSSGNYFLLRIPDGKEGPGNPSASMLPQASMGSFTGIPVMIAQFIYSV